MTLNWHNNPLLSTTDEIKLFDKLFQIRYLVFKYSLIRTKILCFEKLSSTSVLFGNSKVPIDTLIPLSNFWDLLYIIHWYNTHWCFFSETTKSLLAI